MYYYKTLKFYWSKNTRVQRQGCRIPCFYLGVLYFSVSTEKSAEIRAPPIHQGLTCGPSLVCQLQKGSQAAHGQPVPCCCSRVPMTEPCLLWANPGGVFASSRIPLLYRVYAWQSESVPEEACRAAVRKQLRYAHSAHTNPELPTSSSVSQVHLLLCKKIFWKKFYVLHGLLELLHLVWRSVIVPA